MRILLLSLLLALSASADVAVEWGRNTTSLVTVPIDTNVTFYVPLSASSNRSIIATCTDFPSQGFNSGILSPGMNFSFVFTKAVSCVLVDGIVPLPNLVILEVVCPNLTNKTSQADCIPFCAPMFVANGVMAGDGCDGKTLNGTCQYISCNAGYGLTTAEGNRTLRCTQTGKYTAVFTGDILDCIDCQGGAFYQDSNNEAVCRRTTDCQPGQEELIASTSTSDRVCQNCTQGLFSANGTSCNRPKDCGPGEEEAQAPTPTSDRVCRPCIAGSTFNSITGGTCAPVRTCGVGLFEAAAPTRSSNRICQDIDSCISYPCAGLPCRDLPGVPDSPAGRACLENITAIIELHNFTCVDFTNAEQNRFLSAIAGLTNLLSPEDARMVSVSCRNTTAQCPIGSYITVPFDGSTNPITEQVCERWSECQPGSFVVFAGNLTQNTVCGLCDGTTNYQDVKQQTSCKPLSPACRIGQFQTLNPSRSSDRSCTNCPAGFTDHDNNPLTPCVPCSAGTFVPEGKNGTCSSFNCTSGYIDSDNDPATQCTPCEAGQFVPPGAFGSCDSYKCRNGTTDDDKNPATACERCPVGSYVPDGSVGICDLYKCDFGTTDHDRDPATPCIPCGNGTYADRGSAGACQPCSPGTVDHDGDARTPCLGCAAGQFMQQGSVGPCSNFQCPPGSVTANPAVSCARCSNGTSANSFQSACDVCPAGSTDHDANPATPCISCGPGFFVPQGSFGSCANFACRAGSTDHDSDPTTDCVACGRGHEITSTNNTGSCSSFECQPGFSDIDNNPANSCVRCGSGTEVNQTKAFGPCDSFACKAGFIDHDNDSSTACVPCGPGAYVPPGRSGSCANFICVNGTLDDDSKASTPCVSCNGGHSIPNNSSGPCSNFRCPAGTTDPESDDMGACVPCTRGSYAQPGTKGLCPLCDKGSVDADEDPSTPCVKCGAGNFTQAGRWGACTPCAAGSTDHDSKAETECQACTAGTFVPAGSSGSCDTFKCPLGRSDTDNNPATSCEVCSNGTYVPLGSAGNCSDYRCAAGRIDDDFNAATPCLSCSNGTYVPRGSSGNCSDFLCPPGTADLDGSPSTECASCTLGVSFQNETGATTCKSVRVCAQSEIQDSPPTTSSDRTCKLPQRRRRDDCDFSANFIDGNNDCVPLTICTAGSYVSVNATENSDRECTPCAAGTLDHDSDPFTQCESCTAGGYYVPMSSSGGTCTDSRFLCAPGTTDHDNSPASSCIQCESGQFLNGSTVRIGPCTNFKCPNGTIDHDNDPSTSCQPCNAGSFVPEGSTGSCETYKCPMGTSDSDFDPATECQLCGRGTYVPLNATGPCGWYNCSSGQIDDDNDPTTPCISCSAGNFVPPGSSGNCSSFICPAGTVDDDSNPATSCVSCTNLTGRYYPPGSVGLCDDVEFVCKVGTTDHDKNVTTPCQTCGAGYAITSTTQSSSCSAYLCPAGTTSTDITSASPCVPCGFGTYAPAGSNVTCASLLCPAGTTDHDSNPTTPCQPCSPGTQVLSAGSYGPCSDYVCQAGTTDEDRDPTTPCKPCNGSGLYLPANSTGSCSDYGCAEGTTDDDGNSATPCIICGAGTYVQRGSTGPCSNFNCSAGRTDDDESPATPCVPCSSGTYAPPGSFGTCTLLQCKAGTTDHDNDPTTSCEPCLPGSYVRQGSSGPCSNFLCPAGSVDHDSRPDTPCSNCTDPGLYVSPGSTGECSSYPCQAGTTDHDLKASTSCVDCQPGNYTNVGNFGPCKKCPAGSTDDDSRSSTPCITCGPGFHVWEGSVGACPRYECPAGTTDEDSSSATECKPCPAGTYTGPRNVGPCDPCPPGFADTDSNSSTVCQPCNGKTYFQNLQQQTVCKPTTVCDVDTQYETIASTSTSDRLCAALRECDPRTEKESVKPTPTSDRQCASWLLGYTQTVVSLATPTERKANVTQRLPAIVSDGSLLTVLQGVSSLYRYTTLIYYNESRPSRSDNPAVGMAFVYATARITGISRRVFQRKTQVFQTVVMQNVPRVKNVGIISFADTSASRRRAVGEAVVVVFRTEVSQNDSQSTQTSLQQLVTGNLTVLLGQADSAFVGTQSSLTGPVTIVIHVNCAPCSSPQAPNEFLALECQGQCALCRVCPEGFYEDVVCTGANDTVCSPLPGFQEIVPVSVTSRDGVGLPASALNKNTADVYNRSFSAFGESGSGASGQIIASVGRLNATADFTTNLQPATRLRVSVVTSSVYADSLEVRAVAQVRDVAQNTRVPAVSVYLSIWVGAQRNQGNLQRQTCTTNTVTGLCTLTIAVPSSWAVDAAPSSISYSYGLWVDNAESSTIPDQINAIPIVPAQTQFFDNNVIALLPARPIYPGQSFTFDVIGHSFTELGYFMVQVRILDTNALRIEPNGLKIVNAGKWTFSAQYTLVGGAITSATCTGYLTRPELASLDPLVDQNNRQRDQRLFTVTMSALEGAPANLEAKVQVIIRALRLADGDKKVNPNNVEIGNNGVPALLYGRTSYNTNGSIFIGEDRPVALFPYTSSGQGDFMNTAVLSGKPFSSSLVVLGAYPGPTLTRSLTSGLSCTSSAPTVLKVQPTCATVGFDGSETAGSREVNVTVTAGAASALVSFRVWFPRLPLTVSLDTPVLRPILGVFDAQNSCSRRYQSTRVTAMTSFQMGTTQTPQVDVTGLVTFSSSNTTVATVSGSTVAGRGNGMATISLSGSLGSVSVDVRSDRSAVPLGLSISRVSSLSVSFTGAVDRWSTTLQDAVVTLNRGNMTVEDQRDVLVTSAVLLDPVTKAQSRMILSPAMGLSLTSDAVQVAALSDTDVVAKASGSATIAAAWGSGACSNLTSNLKASLLVNVRLPPANSVTFNLDTTPIAVPNDPVAVAGLPVQATASVELLYPNNVRRVATLDSRTVYESNDTSVAEVRVEGGVAKVLAKAPGTARITVRFTHETVTASADVSVVGFKSLTLDALPYSTAGLGSTAINALRPIGNTGLYQRAALRLRLTRTDDFVLDISTNNLVSFIDSTAGGALLDVTRLNGGRNVVSVKSGVSSGTSIIEASFAGRTERVGISVSTSKVTIKTISAVTVAGATTGSGSLTLNSVRDSSSFVVRFNAVLSDDTQLAAGDIFDLNNVMLYDNFVTFSSDTPSVASVNATTGRITLRANSNKQVLLTVTAVDENKRTGSVSVFCNLRAAAFDVDLGAALQVPIPSQTVGQTFSVPLLVTTGDKMIAGLEIRVVFNNSLLDITKIDKGTQFGSGTLETSVSGPEAKLVGLSDGFSGSDVSVAVITFRAKAAGSTEISGTVISLTEKAYPFTNRVITPTAFVAGRVPLDIVSSRRRRDEPSAVGASFTGLSETDPLEEELFFADMMRAAMSDEVHEQVQESTSFDSGESEVEVMLVRRTASAGVLGDINLDNKFSIIDVQFVKTFLEARSENFLSSDGPTMLGLSNAQKLAMDVNNDRDPSDPINFVMNDLDVLIMTRILSGSLRFVSIPEVVSVSDVDSDCLLTFGVHIEQSSAEPSYAQGDIALASQTLVYFDIAGNTANVGLLTQLQNSTWPYNVIAKPPSSTLFGALVEAKHVSRGDYKLSSATWLSQTNAVGLSVWLITLSNGRPSAISNRLFTGPDRSPYLYSSAYTQSEDINGVTLKIDRPSGYNPLVTFRNNQTTDACLAERRVGNLRATKVDNDGTRAEVSWTLPSRPDRAVTGYRVSYRVQRDPKQLQVLATNQEEFSEDRTFNVSSAATSSITIGGLQPFVTYEFRVQTVNALRASVFSDIVSVLTAESAPARPPLNVAGSSNGSTSVLVSWSAPQLQYRNGVIRKYFVEAIRVPGQARADPNGFENRTIAVGAVTSFIFEGLEENIEYDFRVYAETLPGLSGPGSAPVRVITDPKAPDDAPKISAINALNSTSLQVNWNEPALPLQNGAIAGYIVAVKRATATKRADGSDIVDADFNSTDTYRETDVAASPRSLTITELLNGITYDVRVRAYVVFGGKKLLGPWGTVEQRMTLEGIPSGPPIVDSVVSEDPRKLTVTFRQPEPRLRNGVITSFEIIYWRNENQNNAEGEFNCSTVASGRTPRACSINFERTAIVYNLAEFKITIELLEEDVSYSVVVRASTAVGKGPESTAVTKRTIEAAPDGPINGLATESLTSTTATLTWSPPDLPRQNGVLMGFEIYVVRDATGDFLDRVNPLSEPAWTLRLNVGLPASIVRSGTSKYTVTGLDKYMRYRISISAYTSAGLGVSSTPITFSTLQDRPTGRVVNFVKNEDAGVPESEELKSVILSWSPPLAYQQNGIILGYFLTYQFDDPRVSVTAGPRISVNLGNVLTYRVNGLRPFVRYRFEIMPYTTAGNGTIVEPVFAVTVPFKPSGTPTNFKVMDAVQNRAGDRIRLSWEDPDPWKQNGVITGYRVSWLRVPGQTSADPNIVDAPVSTRADEIVTTSARLVGVGPPFRYELDLPSVANLEADVLYDFEVSALNGKGEGPTAQLLGVRTGEAAPDGEPTNFGFTATTDTLTLNWAPPLPHLQNGVITYRLTYQALDYNFKANGGLDRVRPGSPLPTTISSISITTFTLNRLTPYMLYSITLQAVTKRGAGPAFSAQVRTRPKAPSRPPTPWPVANDGTHSASSSIKVRWDTINDEWGPVTKLQIIVEPEGSLLFNLTTVSCDNGVQDGYELGPDCGGWCSPCDPSTPIRQPPLGTWQSNEDARVNKARPIAYVAYERDMSGLSASQTGGSAIIGDGFNYGGAKNGILAAGKKYTFRLRIFTGDSPLLSSVSDIFPDAVASTNPSGGGSPMAMIAAAAIIIVILVAVILFVVYRRRHGLPILPFVASKSKDGSYTQTVSPFRSNDVEMDYRSNKVPQTQPYAVRQTNMQQPLVAIPPVPQLPPVERHEIAVSDLPRIIQQMSANSNFAFSEEYECVEQGNEFSREVAKLEVNKMKNRYANILAYDYTRVKISVINNDPYSDYINANYIDGYNKKKAYIAAQGPTPLTVVDFWRMLDEQGVTTLIMLTNLEEKGRIKCHRYWPAVVGQTMPLTSQMSVSLTNEEEFPDFVIRTLALNVRGQVRDMRQFHFTTWPDHGVPDSTEGCLMMTRKAREFASKTDAPILVHCSAGVGRTGTVIVIDYNLEKAKVENKVDVFGSLNQMRRQRSTMVQTEDQYVYIYRALADGVGKQTTEMDPDGLRRHYASLDFPNPEGGTNLEVEFKALAAGPQPAVRTDSAQLTANKPKNRFQNILPYEATRVKLVPIPGVVGSDYINASWIDGWKQKGAFIATQGPTDATLADFWRMVWERECHSIVMLTNLTENGRAKSEQYWPDADEDPLVVGDFQVILEREHDYGFCIERTFSLIDLVSDQQREVKHWQYTDWPSNGVPEDGCNMINIIDMVEAYARSRVIVPREESIYGNHEAINEQHILKQMRPLVVHCSAGVGRTGTFCAAVICLKRVKEDNKVDLFSVTKHLRTQRTAMIQTPDQYAFVYRLLIDYLDGKTQQSIYQNVASARKKAPVVPVMPAYNEDSFMSSAAALGAELDLENGGESVRVFEGGRGVPRTIGRTGFSTQDYPVEADDELPPPPTFPSRKESSSIYLGHSSEANTEEFGFA